MFEAVFRGVSPQTASYLLWAIWAASWAAASFWAKPAAAAPSVWDETKHRVPTVIGYVLIIFSARLAGHGYRIGAMLPLWPVEPGFGWLLLACELAGFAFTWWARIHLGALWSSSVTRKEDHRVVDTGPYRLVRHPIYTGMLFSTLALVVEIATPAAFAGLVLATLGFWLKARLEERFLGRELASASYDAYRRRTPMLLPFWPRSG
jgi:protein-S-isoprenylcysteine O-methyltransferase Ste14